MNRSTRWRWVVGVLVSLTAHGTAATVLQPRWGVRSQAAGLDGPLTIHLVHSREAHARTQRLEAKVLKPLGGASPPAPRAEVPATTAKPVAGVSAIPGNPGPPPRAEVSLRQQGKPDTTHAESPLDKPIAEVEPPAPVAEQILRWAPHSPESAVVGLDGPTAAPAAIAVPSVAVVRKPRFRSRPSPPLYPRRSRQRQQEGVVVLDALVGARGRVREILVWKSSGFPLLDEAAREAMAQWEFEPASDGGEILESWVRVPVQFALR